MTAVRSPQQARGRAVADRAILRKRLLAEREQLARSALAPQAQREVSARLAQLLHELEPGVLGLYWPVRDEFNPCDAARNVQRACPTLALPYAQREPHAMHYRAWNGQAPDARDECGVPAPADGGVVVPDVVLVPCVGYTHTLWRLGYGGGYFDRWLALHPHVTAVGVAWSASEIASSDWNAQPHDRQLTVIVTESGIVG